MSKIDPTIGRMILFHPPINSTHAGLAANSICAAIIAKVLPDGRLNLAVFDGNGASYSMAGVPLIQDGDTRPKGFFAEWMPYQKSVANGETAPVLHATPTSAPSPFSTAANPVPMPAHLTQNSAKTT